MFSNFSINSLVLVSSIVLNSIITTQQFFLIVKRFMIQNLPFIDDHDFKSWIDAMFRFIPSRIRTYFLRRIPESDIDQLMNQIEVHQLADIDGLEQFIQNLSKSSASMDLLVVDGIPMVFSNLKLLGLEMSRSEQQTRFNNLIERLIEIQKIFKIPVLITGWAKTELEIKFSNYFIPPPLSRCLYITHDIERVFFIKEVHSNPEIIGHFIVTWEEIISLGVTAPNSSGMEII